MSPCLAAFMSDELAALVGDEEPITDTSQARESSRRSDDATVDGTDTAQEHETPGGPDAADCAGADEGTDEAEAEAAAAVAAAERELAAGYTMSKQSGGPDAAEGSAVHYEQTVR